MQWWSRDRIQDSWLLPLCCLPWTEKEVRSKKGNLNLCQALNLRATTFFCWCWPCVLTRQHPLLRFLLFWFCFFFPFFPPNSDSQAGCHYLSFPETHPLHLYPQDFKWPQIHPWRVWGQLLLSRKGRHLSKSSGDKRWWFLASSPLVENRVDDDAESWPQDREQQMLELSSSPQCPVSSVWLSGGFQDVLQLPNDRCVLFRALVAQVTFESFLKKNARLCRSAQDPCCMIEESAVFVQHKQELVRSTGSVWLVLPRRIYTSVVHNGQRKQQEHKAHSGLVTEFASLTELTEFHNCLAEWKSQCVKLAK